MRASSALRTRVSPVVLAIPQEMDALPVLLATLGLLQGGTHVMLLTGGTCGISPAKLVTTSHAGSCGLGRTARSEMPLLNVHRCSRCCEAIL